MMAKVNIENGVITIDTNSMDDEEKSGVLEVRIELDTCTATMRMLEKDS